MDDPKPWLCQGDVFARVPRLIPTFENGRIGGRIEYQAALLITHGCVMDKAGSDGTPKTRQLTFAPLSLPADFPLIASTLPNLRSGSIDPSQLVLIPNHSGNPETVANLHQVFYLPVELFSARIKDFSGDSRLEEDGTTIRLVIDDHHERSSSMDTAELSLLHKKLMVNWTRFRPKDISSEMEEVVQDD